MTQLIVGGIELPKTSKNRYRAYPERLGKQITMINGRIVTEHIGTVWQIEYEYDYMGNDLMRALLFVLREGGKIEVTFLPDNADTMLTAYFMCTKQPVPQCAFTRNGKALWHNIVFELREVEPHD